MNYSSSEGDDAADSMWIQWFCNLEGHEFLVQIPEHYIREEDEEENLEKLEKIINKRAQEAQFGKPIDPKESAFAKAKQMILGPALETT